MPLVIMIVERMNTAVSNAFNQQEMDVADANVYPTKQILEILGNILAENDEYCKTLLEKGLLTFLQSIYYDQSNCDLFLKLEVLFCWGNIAGGRYSQDLFNSITIQDLIRNISNLHQSQSDIDYEMARRTMLIICNFICECDDTVCSIFLI